MSNLSIFNFQDFVQIKNSQPVTNSQFIARAFNKRHDNVLAKIDELLTQVPDFFGKLNFKETEKTLKNNLGFEVKQKFYELTKDGFMLLVMGFTGRQAMQIKIAYIEAFNKMAEKLEQIYFIQTLTPAQKQEIREAVKARHYRTGEHWQAIYEKLHSFLKVNTYHEIQAKDFQVALDFLCHSKNAPLVMEKNELSPEMICAIGYLLAHAQDMKLFISRYLVAFENLGIDNKGALYSYVYDTIHTFDKVRDFILPQLPISNNSSSKPWINWDRTAHLRNKIIDTADIEDFLRENNH